MKASDNPFVRVIHTLRTGNPTTPSDSSWNVYAKADGIYAQSSNAVVGPFGAGTAMSLGSNAMAVGATNQAGTTGTYVGSDHRHLGLHSITSSSSNTLDRPTVNFRAGAGVGITATDSDGNGVFDTVTITASGAAGGGGSAGQNARYLDNSSHANYTTTSTSFADLDSASNLTITTGAHKVLLGCSGMIGNSGGSTTAVDFTVDGTRQGHATLGLTGTNNTTDALGLTYLTAQLSAGSHTFKIQWKVTANTGTWYANTTGVAVHFWAIEQDT